MADARLSCRGFELDGYHVPPFDVRSGVVVTLQLPARLGLEAALIDVLTGARHRPQVEVAGRCQFAAPAQPRVGWHRWFNDPTPADWLRRRGFDRDAADAVLGRLRIDGRLPISRFAATPRALLGIESAFRDQADIVLFHTHGLDPLGFAALVDLVQSRLDRVGGVYVSTPIRAAGQESYRVFPGSTVLEIVGPPPVTV